MNVSSSKILGSSILIVDDQDADVLLLQSMLTNVGYCNISSTSQPAQVRQLHLDNHYDLILLDLHMPGVDGFEVMRQLKADLDNDYLPVIVVTAQPGHTQKALEAGARDFIHKPFDFLEAKTRIRNMLEVRQLYRQIERHCGELEQKVADRTAELRASETRFKRLTELAADWYWEQDENGKFVAVSGPVLETVGQCIGAFMGDGDPAKDAARDTESDEGAEDGWNPQERLLLKHMIETRRPFIDFVFGRLRKGGLLQQFRVSGEPMLDSACRFVGYRGIGAEVQPPWPAPAPAPAPAPLVAPALNS